MCRVVFCPPSCGGVLRKFANDVMILTTVGIDDIHRFKKNYIAQLAS